MAGAGGANIPSHVAMAGEHWYWGNDGFEMVFATAVGDVMDDEVLRIRGFSIIGVPGSDMEDDDDGVESSVSFKVEGCGIYPYPRGPGVGTESSSYSISRTSNDNPLSVFSALRVAT
jgi:hypothetical protein